MSLSLGYWLLGGLIALGLYTICRMVYLILTGDIEWRKK